MLEIIEQIAAQAGIDTDVAHKATSLIADFISKSAPAETLDALRRQVPGFDDVAATGAAHAEAASAENADGGLLGGLLGGGGIAGAIGGLLGGSQGGGFGGAMALVGNLQKEGLDLTQMQSLAGGLVERLRATAGDEVVDKLVADIPGIGRFLA